MKSGEKAEKPEEKSREAQRRGEDRMQKDTYVTTFPRRNHQSASDEKDETSRNETKTTGEEEKSEEEEDKKIDAGQTTEQERQTRG